MRKNEMFRKVRGVAVKWAKRRARIWQKVYISAKCEGKPGDSVHLSSTHGMLIGTPEHKSRTDPARQEHVEEPNVQVTSRTQSTKLNT